MNSQIVAINQAVRSKNTFFLVTSLIPVSLFLNAGFTSVVVIWFTALCLYNYHAVPLGEKLRDFRMLLVPMAFFACRTLWVLFFPNGAPTIDILLREVHIFLIPLGFLVVDKKVTNKQLEVVLTMFLLACLTSSFLCLGNAVLSIVKSGSFVENGPSGTQKYLTYFKLAEPVHISPTYLAMFCNWAFFIVLRTPHVNRLLRTLIALYLGGFIMLLSTIVGSLCLVVVAVFWLQSTTSKKATRYVLGGALIIVLMVGLNKCSAATKQFKLDPNEQHGDLVNSLSTRLVIWTYAWETIKANPVIGYGLGGGQLALEENYKKNNFSWGARESLNAHNQFLSTLLDLGGIGFCVLMAMLLVPLVEAMRSKDLLMTGFLVMIVVFFCFESVLLRQKGIVFFSFFYAVISLRLMTTVSGGIRQPSKEENP